MTHDTPLITIFKMFQSSKFFSSFMYVKDIQIHPSQSPPNQFFLNALNFEALSECLDCAEIDITSVFVCFIEKMWISWHYLQIYETHLNTNFNIYLGPTVLFTHLKIIWLQCFQFSTINGIPTDPNRLQKQNDKKKNL